MEPSKPRGEGLTISARGSAEPVEMLDVAVLLNPNDAVFIAKQPLLPRTVVRTPEGARLAGSLWAQVGAFRGPGVRPPGRRRSRGCPRPLIRIML